MNRSVHSQSGRRIKPIQSFLCAAHTCQDQSLQLWHPPSLYQMVRITTSNRSIETHVQCAPSMPTYCACFGSALRKTVSSPSNMAQAIMRKCRLVCPNRRMASLPPLPGNCKSIWITSGYSFSAGWIASSPLVALPVNVTSTII